MSTEGGDDGIDAAAATTETKTTHSAQKTRPRPRPPAPVAPGDLAPRVGRVVAVRKSYDRYLSVEQRDVEVDAAGAKVKVEREEEFLFFHFVLFSSTLRL